MVGQREGNSQKGAAKKERTSTKEENTNSMKSLCSKTHLHYSTQYLFRSTIFKTNLSM